MKNKELMGCVVGLQKVMEVKGTKFGYAVMKNMKALGNQLAAFQAMRVDLDPEYMNYDADRIKLAELHCEKLDGKPKIEKDPQTGQDNYVFSPDNRVLFDADLEKLRETHKEAYERHQKKDADFNALMEKQSDFVFHKVSTKDLPEGLSAAQIMAVEPMLTEMALVEDLKKGV